MKDQIEIKIRGYHIDSYGHVNNTRYLEFLEEARWVLKDRYFDFFDKDPGYYGLVVANNTIDYLSPAFLGDVLKIESSVIQIGNKSVVFKHEIKNKQNNRLILKAKATFVFYNNEANKSEQIPNELRKKFLILSDDNH